MTAWRVQDLKSDNMKNLMKLKIIDSTKRPSRPGDCFRTGSTS
jgi:hypothetical protein